MPFLSCMLTYQIFFYLTIVCNLARCSFNASSSSSSDLEDGTRLVTGCRYAYPDYVSPYVMSCRNIYANEIPLHQNVTKMELLNVPVAVLNETLIPEAVRSELVDLRQLHWTKSHIKLLESVAIPTLVDLDLSWNVIQDVLSNALNPLVRLKKFNISHNNIDRLPPNLLDECHSVNVLSVSHNQLKALPHAFFDKLDHLEILDLSNNHLSHLKETLFKYNSRLLNLNLSFNKITTLPASLFRTTSSLQSLSLEDNHLFVLEADTFMHLHELMVLNLGKNPLWSMPATLLPNNNTLFILTISHTRLLRIRLTALQNLRWLRSLHLTDNANLQNLYNDTFASLTNLNSKSESMLERGDFFAPHNIDGYE